MDQLSIVNRIVAQLDSQKIQLHQMYVSEERRIQHFVLDDLLDESSVRLIYQGFPSVEEMVLKKSMRENKYIAVQMDRYNETMEKIVYAFQDPRVVCLLAEITGISPLFPDPNLYAGGLSTMVKGQFLNPHLDNSHDKDRRYYRLLNLLYYVTPDWKEEYGGNLELWENGLSNKPTTVWSKFNRLVCMITHRYSWHSVSPVQHDGSRCCVSNYYFSPVPVDRDAYFHVTSFRGRPEQRFGDLVLRGDGYMRGLLRKVFRLGIRKNPHVYKRGGGPVQ